MNVLVKYPSRARPDLFRETLALYLLDPTVDVLCSFDTDDASMNNGWMRDFLATQDRVRVRWGNCQSKVQAVNDGLDVVAWDGICIIGSDDMLPQRADYGQRTAELFRQNFPDGDGVLHLNDGRVGKVLNTLSILDRKYFDRFGYVYRDAIKHEGDGYRSTHCDDEFQAISENTGRAVYVDEVVIAHKWIGETHPTDNLHRHNESFYSQDGRTFQRRKALGFPT